MAVETTTAQVAERFVDAFNGGDAQVLMDLLTDDVTWTLRGTLPVSGVYEGRDSVMNDFLAKALPWFAGDLKFEMTNLVADSDHAVIEWTARGHAANGREYHNFYAMVLEVRDGKVSAVREYTDSLYVHDVVFT
jgi:ketosteroid isomerase-like protein